jgi:hypothetical protein
VNELAFLFFENAFRFADVDQCLQVAAVVIFFLLVTRFQLLYEGWRGYLIAWFALVWVANQYMSLYGRLRLDIKSERLETDIKEKVAEKVKKESDE